MKLGKILFPILGSVAMLPMTGLTSCGNNTPFEFDPDITNIMINKSLEKSSAGSFNCLACYIPVTISLKDKQFSEKDNISFFLSYSDEGFNYEVLEGEDPGFSHISLLNFEQKFNDGKVEWQMKFCLVFKPPHVMPTNHFRLNFTCKFKTSIKYHPQDQESQEYEIKNCVLKGIVDYTPSEEK